MDVPVSRGVTMFMHIMTGMAATREDWEASYAKEELTERGLTAQQAFIADLGVTLFPLAVTTYEAPAW